ncbi:agmatine deiminase family protein [Kitasatospora sp. NPDC018058]|uniref:agmatine deiminase family protein n=1 Tax=Kitasatospora sp. NPDC018058 TaxID=3364025 RepID=UPI0037C190AC
MSHYRDDRSTEAYPRVPADDVPHARTWMSWPSRRGVWGLRLGGVQEDIALIARTVAEFEPVVMCAPDDWTADKARARCGSAVEVITAIPTDDLWMRDIAPVFRRDGYGGRRHGDGHREQPGQRAAFPGREVVQLDVDRLMTGGGGIHCSTMHEPLP